MSGVSEFFEAWNGIILTGSSTHNETIRVY